MYNVRAHLEIAVPNKLANLVTIDYEDSMHEESPNMLLSIYYIYIGQIYLLIKHSSHYSNKKNIIF